MVETLFVYPGSWVLTKACPGHPHSEKGEDPGQVPITFHLTVGEQIGRCRAGVSATSLCRNALITRFVCIQGRSRRSPGAHRALTVECSAHAHSCPLAPRLSPFAWHIQSYSPHKVPLALVENRMRSPQWLQASILSRCWKHRRRSWSQNLLQVPSPSPISTGGFHHPLRSKVSWYFIRRRKRSWNAMLSGCGWQAYWQVRGTFCLRRNFEVHWQAPPTFKVRTDQPTS